MLIHITPKLYGIVAGVEADLMDVSIPELALQLRGGAELVARRPYVNKNYLVACRRVGQKAMAGLLVESSRSPRSFNVVTRWRMNDAIATHHVEYHVIDADYACVSDSMMLWYQSAISGDVFSNRWPTHYYRDSCPVHAQPRMDMFSNGRKSMQMIDSVAKTGLIQRREEVFHMPTLEPKRLEGELARSGRIPPLEHAFLA